MSTDKQNEVAVETGTKLVDLQGRQQEDLRKGRTFRTIRGYLSWRRYRESLHRRLELLKGYLRAFGRARFFILVSGIVFLTAIILAGAGMPGQALLPALVGFGLSSTALLLGAFPQLARRLENLSRHVSRASWALLVTSFAFLGFSSTAVIALVLFVGGFTVVNVLWGLLPRILSMGRGAGGEGPGAVREAPASPNPLLMTMAAIAAWSFAASFLMGFLRVHESMPFGTAFLSAHVGLILGLLPFERRMLAEIRKPTLVRWILFQPRRLLRDVIFMTVVAGLIGYEVTLVTSGGAFAGIPAFAVGLVLVSYIGVLVRHLSPFHERLRPYHPLVLPAFGVLLLFAPLVVVLSNPPATVTRLYGGAQAAGLVVGVAFIAMRSSWRESAHRIRVRIQEAVKKRVPLEAESQEPPDPYERIGGRAPEGDGKDVRVREAKGDEEDKDA